MTHVDDLYEAKGREPEPCDWFPAPVPVDLEEVETAFDAHLTGGASTEGKEAASVVLEAVPSMLVELRAARERIAEWEALEKREEWSVTGLGEPAPDPASGAWGGTAELAADYVAKHRVQAWRRTVHMRPGEPIDTERPF